MEYELVLIVYNTCIMECFNVRASNLNGAEKVSANFDPLSLSHSLSILNFIVIVVLMEKYVPALLITEAHSPQSSQ